MVNFMLCDFYLHLKISQALFVQVDLKLDEMPQS